MKEGKKMAKVYKISLDQQVVDALEREARQRSQSPADLIESVLRNWLVEKGNLRIY